MILYGLIGFPLSHSFSQKYFRAKFSKENISKVDYHLYEVKEVSEVVELFENKKELQGVNVTIPHKQSVIPFLDALDPIAKRINAVNVIKRLPNGKLKGYNTDYWGFKISLEKWIAQDAVYKMPDKALILGNGGASQAVKVALQDLEIAYKIVSRSPSEEMLSYEDLTPEILIDSPLIINCTPLGMSPNIETFPNISYKALTSKHYLYDLVYNPSETKFMRLGESKGATVSNGLEMLHIQAEKAWEIWRV